MSNAATAKPYVPWSHLTKEDFVFMKKKYVKYWRRHLPNHNYANVFSELVYHVNYETGACFPSRALIASHIGKSEKTVQRAIKALEDHGLIEVRRLKDLPRSEDGVLVRDGFRSNLYLIYFDRILVDDEMGLPVISDFKSAFLTLAGRRRFPPNHSWYDCDDVPDTAKLPPLGPPDNLPVVPPGPSSDGDVPSMSHSDDLALPVECLTKAKEGYQGHEGKEGEEGTDVAHAATAASGECVGSMPLEDVARGPEEIPAPGEQHVVPAPGEQHVIPRDSDLSRKPELTVSYMDQIAIQGQKSRKQKAERQERESAAKREKEALFRAWEQEVAARPHVPEIPLVEEEEPLTD